MGMLSAQSQPWAAVHCSLTCTEMSRVVGMNGRKLSWVQTSIAIQRFHASHFSFCCRLTWHQDVQGDGDERKENELGLELGVQGGHCHHNSIHCPAHAQAARGHSSPQAPGVGHQAAGHAGAGKEGKKLGGAVVVHQEGACM